MNPSLCFRTLDTSRGYVVKNYGKRGGEGNQKIGGKIFFPIFRRNKSMTTQLMPTCNSYKLDLSIKNTL